MTTDRFCELAATLTRPVRQNDSGGLVELGMRTLRTGQVARWGRHLRGELPYSDTVRDSVKGIYQIEDKSTGLLATVNRNRDGTTDQWWKDKFASIDELRLNKKHRKTLAGGKAIKKFLGGTETTPEGAKIPYGIHPHFDKRGITSHTTAGAFEQVDPIPRQQGTATLVRGYQERANYKINPNETSNPYNVSMIRKPNPAPQKPMSDQQITETVNRYQRNSIRRDAKEAANSLHRVASGAALVTAGTQIATSPKKETSSHPHTREIIGGVVGLGGATSLYRNAPHIGNVLGKASRLASEARAIAGYKLSGRFPRVSKRVLGDFL